ncbi:MAG: oligosaccharide flippase family protein [candidate division Zixibacteria bacterium]|jgi:O-antigen/teichoic acid export membrane protein|nr:oligosaccharide flippase family protein [candidate division Zixibacteria bacterium]
MLKSSAVYFGSSIVNKAIPFLLLPVLTRYLSPAEYGTVAIFQVLLTFLNPVVDLNISQNILRKYFHLSREDLAAYIANILLVLFGSFTVATILLAAVVLFTGNVFGLPAGWITVLPLISLVNMVNKCNLVLLIQERRPLAYGTYEIGSTILNVTVSLTLIIAYGMGWEGRATGILTASVIIGLISLVHMRRRRLLLPSVSSVSIREILKVSLPLVPHMLGIVVVGFTDRLFIDRMLGKEAVGIYAVGYQFGMITMLFGDAFMKSWSPWFFRAIKDPLRIDRGRIVRYTYGFVAAMIAAALAITAASHLAFDIMVDAEFSSGLSVVLWIALGFAVRGIYQCMLLYLIHEGRTSFLAINTAVAAVANIGLTYLLISINGAVGAAQASLIAYGIMSIGTWWYANRIYSMPWFSPRPALDEG